MKALRTTTLVIISAAIFLSVMTGCGSKKTLVGTWQEEGKDGAIIEFLADGTFNVQPPKDAAALLADIKINGKWTMLEDGKCKMEISAMGTTNTENVKVEFQADELIVTGPDGNPARHKRLK